MLLCSDGSRRVCLRNGFVCDGDPNCRDKEDEDPDICQLKIQTSMGNSPKKGGERKGTGRRWSIFCIARNGGQLTWYRKRQNPYSFVNISRRAKRCMKSHKCRYSIKQTLWPGEPTLHVSELHIKALKVIDFGAYTCRMPHLQSSPFKLVRQKGRCQSLFECNDLMKTVPSWTENFPLNPKADILCRNYDAYLNCRERYLKLCKAEDRMESREHQRFYQYFCSHDGK
ncbi:hypothetical protein ElyMa_006577300 [Elysia marginata]|uniref:Ig-like domain-containing protein n=1 Tax=Elysia marginata TaxID=1093978 RepID=A0AAV4IFJ6_9GAST|nr:hypothetical protein ElyMa_006577300 [Elysia marginata]